MQNRTYITIRIHKHNNKNTRITKLNKNIQPYIQWKKNETNRTWKNEINENVISEGTKRKRDPQPCFPYYSYTNVGKVNSIQIFIFVILNFCYVPQHSPVASGFCDVRISRYHIFYFKKWHAFLFHPSTLCRLQLCEGTLTRGVRGVQGGGRHDDSVVTTLGYYICIYFWTYFSLTVPYLRRQLYFGEFISVIHSLPYLQGIYR
jgi:hypothetical protein